MAGKAPTWISISGSVRGLSHIQSNLPNQDACLQDTIRLIRVLRLETEKGPVTEKDLMSFMREHEAKVLLLADGHGSKRHFRSERGSKFAVQAGFKAFQKMLFGLYSQNQLDNFVQAEDRVPDMLNELYRLWQELIAKDIVQERFTPEQNALIENRSVVAYGSTLLGVLVTQAWTLYIQLGDGDILSVYADGTVRQPIPRQPELIANETTSLCQENAVSRFQWHLEANTESDPSLLMLSTDGYANSFREESALLQAGKDFQDLLKTKGPEYIRQELETWLSEMTREGSGDDITLGLLYRGEHVSQTAIRRGPLNTSRLARTQSKAPAPVPASEPVQTQEQAPEAQVEPLPNQEAAVVPEQQARPESVAVSEPDSPVQDQPTASDTQSDEALDELPPMPEHESSPVPESNPESETQTHASEEEPIHAPT